MSLHEKRGGLVGIEGNLLAATSFQRGGYEKPELITLLQYTIKSI